MHKSILPIFVLFMVLLVSSCGLEPAIEPSTPTVVVLTNTPLPTQTPTTTPTPQPPPPTPTPIPVEGFTLTKVNVRIAPGTSLPVIGILENSAAVQIIGRDITGKWWQVLYPEGPDGKGWVAMDFIRTVVTPEVPLAGPGSGGRQTATVLQKLNIRSGPGTNFNTLGIINPQEIVELTGKNATGTWLQINYPGGPDDRGWVSAAFLQLSSTSDLPVLNEFGTPVATSDGEPGTAVPTPSPTIVPAPPDNDSAASPAAVITFSPLGLRLFSFTSDISSPDGDAEDWLQFSPYASQPGQSSQLDISLQCTGNGSLVVELWQNGSALSNWGSLNCGDQNKRLQLAGNQSYLFRLQSSGVSGSLQYVRYTLTIEQGP